MTFISTITYFSAQAQENNGFNINGRITGTNEGEKVILYLAHFKEVAGVDYLEWIKFDSAIIRDSQFNFQGFLQEGPRMFNIAFEKHPDRLSLFINNELVKLIGEVGKKESLKIEGSKAHEDYISLSKIFRIAAAGINKANSDLEDIIPIYLKQPPVKDLIPINEQFIGSLQTIEDWNFVIENCLKGSTSNLALPSLLLDYRQYAINFPFINELYQGMKSELKQSYYGKMLNKYFGNLSLGQLAPNFASETPEGNVLSLYQVSLNNKYTLIDFWSSFCLPCRKENPDLINIYNTYHEKGFNILGVSFDKDRCKWKEAILQDKLPWHQVIDSSRIVSIRTYRAPGFPYNVLINSEGRIIASGLSSSFLRCKLYELFGY